MPAWMSRFWIQLTADRRRFGAMCALVLLGLLLWARIIVISNMPKTAVAEDESERKEQLVGEADDAQDLRADSAQEPVSIVLDARPRRDPFVISPRHFPQPVTDSQSIADRTKSDVQAAEDALTAETRRTAVLRDLANQLSLDAVLTGGDLVMINGRIYRRGELIPGAQEQVWFLLTEVRQRSVLLECEGRQFELKIPEPGSKQGTRGTPIATYFDWGPRNWS